jgi:hypothetical protein
VKGRTASVRTLYQAMVRPEERRKRGSELMKKYRASGNDKYAAASDAMADILLSVAENTEEASQMLRAVEEDFRCTVEEEGFCAEG